MASAVCQSIEPAGRDGRNEAVEWLKEIRDRISDISNKYKGELPADVESDLSELQIVFANLLRKIENVRTRPLPSCPSGLEQFSQDLLRLAWDVLEIILSREGGPVDLSPVVVCVGKALEIELNNSIVQKVRLLAGVEMPDFFGRALPKGRERPVIEVSSGFQVDLSARGRNPNSSITNLPAVLGVCLALLRWAKGQGLEDYPVIQDPEGVRDLEAWVDMLRCLRNKGAHPERVTETDGRMAIKLATDKAAVVFWDWLVMLKKTLLEPGVNENE